jgi:hypothetical protein
MEVTIHPPVPNFRPTVEQAGNAITQAVRTFQASMEWQVDRIREAELSQSKRLTDVELAAEFWHASQVATYARGRLDWGLPGYSPISADRAEDIEHVLSRFAELPHYDDGE